MWGLPVLVHCAKVFPYLCKQKLLSVMQGLIKVPVSQPMFARNNEKCFTCTLNWINDLEMIVLWKRKRPDFNSYWLTFRKELQGMSYGSKIWMSMEWIWSSYQEWKVVKSLTVQSLSPHCPKSYSLVNRSTSEYIDYPVEKSMASWEGCEDGQVSHIKTRDGECNKSGRKAGEAWDQQARKARDSDILELCMD